MMRVEHWAWLSQRAKLVVVPIEKKDHNFLAKYCRTASRSS